MRYIYSLKNSCISRLGCRNILFLKWGRNTEEATDREEIERSVSNGEFGNVHPANRARPAGDQRGRRGRRFLI